MIVILDKSDRGALIDLTVARASIPIKDCLLLESTAPFRINAAAVAAIQVDDIVVFVSVLKTTASSSMRAKSRPAERPRNEAKE